MTGDQRYEFSNDENKPLFVTCHSSKQLPNNLNVCPSLPIQTNPSRTAQRCV